MIDLEDHAIGIQQSKLNIRTQSSLDGLYRVLKAVDRQIALEGSRPINDNLLRAKREEAQARTMIILEDLHIEKERILMAIEEGQGRLVQFHSMKNSCEAAVTVFVQRKEIALADQKTKWCLRVSDFTSHIVDDLQMEDMQDKRRVVENEMVDILQRSIRQVLSLKAIDMVAFNKLMAYLQSIRFQSWLCLYYGCQLFTMICGCEQEYLQGKAGGQSNWSALPPLAVILTESFRYIQTAEAPADMAMVLLPGCLQGVRGLLELLYAARYCCHFLPPSSMPGLDSNNAMKSNRNIISPSNSAISSKRRSKDEGIILRGIREAWEKQRDALVRYLADCLQLFRSSFSQSPSMDFTISEKALKDHVTMSTVRQCFHNQSTALANAIQSARMIYCDSWFQSGEVDEATRNNLLVKALQAGVSALNQYSARLGQPGNITALTVRDPLFFAAQDSPIIAALDMAAATFSLANYSEELLVILTEASNIMQHRYYSFFLASAYIKCMLAGCLYYVDHGHKHIPRSTDLIRASLQKDPLAVALSLSAEKVTAIFCAHRSSLTISHKSMLLLRLLMTDAFMKRIVIEEVVSRPLFNLLDPWLSGDKILEDADDENDASSHFAEDVGSERDDITVNTTTTSMTAESSTASTASSLISLSEMNTMDPPAYRLKFKQVIAQQAFHNYAPRPTEMNVIDVVKFVCESHSQCSEVLEQALLLIDHLANKAHLCKYLLVETGLPLLLQRMLDSRPAELYIAALISLCIEDLDI